MVTTSAIGNERKIQHGLIFNMIGRAAIIITKIKHVIIAIKSSIFLIMRLNVFIVIEFISDFIICICGPCRT